MTVYTIFTIIGIAALLLTSIRYFIARPANMVVCYIQNFVGSLFIFSGFVKAVDPIGTSYKMKEYFEAFAADSRTLHAHIWFLNATDLPKIWEYIANYSLLMSIVMIALELFIGFVLLIGWRPKFTVTIIWWLTLFFTFLTGYTYLSGFLITKKFLLATAIFMALLAAAALPKKERTRNYFIVTSLVVLLAIFLIGKFSGMFFTAEFDMGKMKVTDCGCFGDFIKLKPWETFYKDVFLDVLIFILLLGVKNIKPVFSMFVVRGMAFVAGVMSVFFCLYNTYWNEPLIDFRPYAIGNNIDDLRKEKRPAVIKKTFYYKSNKTGEVKAFSEEDIMHGKMDYAEYDKFVNRTDDVLDEGIPAKVLGLNIYNEDGEEITDTLLHNPNYSMWVISPNLSTTHIDAFKQLNDIAAGCDKLGIKFCTITPMNDQIDKFRHEHNTAYPFYNCDETPLKTMMRSNPGLMLLKNGVVINKWHYMHLPTFEELNNKYFKK